MKKKSLRSVIIFGICAVVWIGKTVYELIDRSSTNTTMLILDAACSVCWFEAFFVSLKRYRSDKNKDE